jgi:hypothetical protein
MGLKTRLFVLALLGAAIAAADTQVFSVQPYHCPDITQCTVPVNGAAGYFVGGSLNEAQNASGSWSILQIFDYVGFAPHSYYCNPNTSWTLTGLGGTINLVQGFCNGWDLQTGAMFTLRYVMVASIEVTEYLQPWDVLSGVVTLTI